ncbi:MAG: hypothetical protein COA67_09520 [Lutibacter sp.]|nr:MAG: hypothetical protein COA67_09520 [Lutibacter sp.]
MRKLAFVLIALMTISTQAQEKERKHHDGERQQFMKDLTPEEAATLRTKKMTLHLDLTESQQVEIKKVNLEMAKERSLKREERKKKMGQEKTKPSKEERLKMMNSHLDKQIETKKKMKEILNEQQYEKWEKSRVHKGRNSKKQGKREGMNRKVRRQ